MLSRKRIQWAVGLTLLLLLGTLGWRVLRPRLAPSVALTTEVRPEAGVELASGDVSVARQLALLRTVAVSGTLKAVSSAMVKARVAGELQGLTLREGDRVRAGEVLARVDPTEYRARVEQAQQQALAAQAQIDIAQRQFDNNQALVQQGFISRTALDTALATLQGAQANFRAAQHGLEVARKALDDCVLRAPLSGLVAQRLAQPGERVAVEARILEIVDPSQLELEASLAAADSLALRVGQSARLQVEGLAVNARLLRINPSAQSANRSVLAYLALDSLPGLRQGLFAQGQIEIGRSQAIAVPLRALRSDKPQPYVQTIEQQRVVHRVVEPGLQDASGPTALVAVTGLQEGAQVIEGHVGPLLAGTAVRFTALPAASTSAPRQP